MFFSKIQCKCLYCFSKKFSTVQYMQVNPSLPIALARAGLFQFLGLKYFNHTGFRWEEVRRNGSLKHWMIDKLGGAFAPKPSSGPHKARECLPLILILTNRLKYALTYREVISILMQRQVMVDGKVRTDKTSIWIHGCCVDQECPLHGLNWTGIL